MSDGFSGPSRPSGSDGSSGPNRLDGDGDGRALEALASAVRSHGVPVLADADLLHSLLAGRIPDRPAQARLLIVAARHGVSRSLTDDLSRQIDPADAVRTAAERLLRDAAAEQISQGAALWAAAVVARVLGYEVPETVLLERVPVLSDEPPTVTVTATAGPAAPVRTAPPAEPSRGRGRVPRLLAVSASASASVVIVIAALVLWAVWPEPETAGIPAAAAVTGHSTSSHSTSSPPLPRNGFSGPEEALRGSLSPTVFDIAGCTADPAVEHASSPATAAIRCSLWSHPAGRALVASYADPVGADSALRSRIDTSRAATTIDGCADGEYDHETYTDHRGAYVGPIACWWSGTYFQIDCVIDARSVLIELTDPSPEQAWQTWIGTFPRLWA